MKIKIKIGTADPRAIPGFTQLNQLAEKLLCPQKVTFFHIIFGINIAFIFYEVYSCGLLYLI